MAEAKKRTENPEIISILDEDQVEENFGNQIHENIMNRLEFLVQAAYTNKSISFLSKSLDFIKSFFTIILPAMA